MTQVIEITVSREEGEEDILDIVNEFLDHLNDQEYVVHKASVDGKAFNRNGVRAA